MRQRLFLGGIVALTLGCGIGVSHAQDAAPPADVGPTAAAPAAPALEASQAPASPEKPPYELVRSMQALQDQMVQGNFSAQAAIPKLSSRIAERLLAAPADVWRDPRNARAAAGYVLAGGQARVGRKVLEAGAIDEIDHRLIEGAVAYAEGRQAKARQLLMDIDARRFAGPLGGHLAFVQAALVPKEDATKVRHFLDMARLLAPGTLIEEAALRREIVLVDDMTDLDMFILLASQYERRFRSSVYADNFRQRFVAALLRIGQLSDVARFARLDTLLSDVKPDSERLNIYLLIAQTAIIKGNGQVARIAADHAAAMAKTATAESARAALYQGAAQLLTAGYDDGLAKLNAVDLAHLPKRDAELARAVLAMAGQIRSWPSDEDIAKAEQGNSPPASQPPAQQKAAAVIDLAQKALSATDELLTR